MKTRNFGSDFFYYLKEQIIKKSFTDRCVYTHTHTILSIWNHLFFFFFKPTDKLLIALGFGLTKKCFSKGGDAGEFLDILGSADLTLGGL